MIRTYPRAQAARMWTPWFTRLLEGTESDFVTVVACWREVTQQGITHHYGLPRKGCLPCLITWWIWSKNMPVVNVEAAKIWPWETSAKHSQPESLWWGLERHVESDDFIIQMGPPEFSVHFQVLDIDTGYNLLLRRLFIHMGGVVASNLHLMMKLVWKNQDLVIHGEGSHCGRQTPILYDESRSTDFYTVEVVNANSVDLAPLTPMPAVYKMISTVMLQNGFERGLGLVRDSHGIINHVPVLVKGSRYGLGYIPTDDDMKMKKKNDQHWLRQFCIRIKHFQSGSMPRMKTLVKESATSSRRSMLLLRKRSS